MNWDPTVRHTFWNIAFGSFFSWITHISVNQGMVQRFLAMPTITKARLYYLKYSKFLAFSKNSKFSVCFAFSASVC